MIKAIVSGPAGRMGGRIIHMLEAAEGIELAAAFERPGHPAVDKDVGEVVGLPGLGIKVADSLKDVLEKGDVLIEFTHPEPSLTHLREVAAANKAMVLGTTGFSPAQIAEIHALGARTRLVFAPNMSVGVNLMFKVVADIAKVLSEGYDVEIVEAHHRNKVDAPSGTALGLGRAVAQGRGTSLESAAVYARHGATGPRPDGAIGFSVVRGGEIIGDHRVIFAGPGEQIELAHHAQDRSGFARGALVAARWVTGRPPGLYSMLDVLGL